MVQFLTFCGGVVFLLLGGAGTMNNKFRDVALDKFQWYLTSINLEVLFKRYLPVCLLLALFSLPCVKWLLRKLPEVTRWAVVWHGALLCRNHPVPLPATALYPPAPYGRHSRGSLDFCHS